MLNGDGALITEDGTRGPTRVIKHVLQSKEGNIGMVQLTMVSSWQLVRQV